MNYEEIDPGVRELVDRGVDPENTDIKEEARQFFVCEFMRMVIPEEVKIDFQAETATCGDRTATLEYIRQRNETRRHNAKAIGDSLVKMIADDILKDE